MAVADETHVVLDIPEGSSWTVNGEVASALEECILPVYLAKARWYPRKSAFEIKLNVIAIVPLFGGASDATSLAIVEAEGRARYILPLMEDWSLDAKAKPEKNIVARLRSGEREGLLRDVAADPTFIRRLLDHLRRETSIAGSGWRLDFKPTSRLANVPARAPVRIRAIEGEQSNSTALVDQDYVIKLYRHIEPGQNPEIEMGLFLTEAVGFAHTPALLGHIEATHRSESYALGIVHAFVPNRGDAWTWSADRINIYLNAVTEGSDERDKALTVRRDYLQWVRRMGRRVAEMHRCLASHEEIPAFKSETIDDRDLDFWINDIMNRASRVFDRLEQRSPLIDDEQDLVQSLLRTRGALPELAARLIRSSLGRRKIRHHGDLHLGQVLVAEEDAIIIDFEGEPSRSLAERRRKAPAARDVAGVMRSLDYAAMAARQQRQSLGKLATPTMRALLTWRDQSIDAFLSGYQEAMGQSVLWPDCHDEAKNMLSFFLLEKALYEVEYELSYRPDWLAVPLQGIIRLLEEKASS